MTSTVSFYKFKRWSPSVQLTYIFLDLMLFWSQMVELILQMVQLQMWWGGCFCHEKLLWRTQGTRLWTKLFLSIQKLRLARQGGRMSVCNISVSYGHRMMYLECMNIKEQRKWTKILPQFSGTTWPIWEWCMKSGGQNSRTALCLDLSAMWYQEAFCRSALHAASQTVPHDLSLSQQLCLANTVWQVFGKYESARKCKRFNTVSVKMTPNK